MSLVLTIFILTAVPIFIYFLVDHFYNDRSDPSKYYKLPKFFLDISFKKVLSKIIPIKVHNAAGELKGKPVLFVCNHQMGGLEVLALYTSIYVSTGVYPRGLADFLWSKFPFVSSIMTLIGCIEGNS